MFIKLKLANGDEATVNTNRIESIERDDDDPRAYQVHVGTRHYEIHSAEHDALLKILNVSGASPVAAAAA